MENVRINICLYIGCLVHYLLGHFLPDKSFGHDYEKKINIFNINLHKSSTSDEVWDEQERLLFYHTKDKECITVLTGTHITHNLLGRDCSYVQ